MNTTKNNKLIAEFLHGKNAVHPNQYHENWNELMQVVEKIENLGFEVVIGRISCNVNEILNRENPITSIVCGNPSKKLEVVYSSICQFIQWHNQQNK